MDKVVQRFPALRADGRFLTLPMADGRAMYARVGDGELELYDSQDVDYDSGLYLAECEGDVWRAVERYFSDHAAGFDAHLKVARGTGTSVQHLVESGRRFQEVVEDIVTTTERGNLAAVGVYCRAGHHRSVACAELIRAHVYPRASVRHLTLNK